MLLLILCLLASALGYPMIADNTSLAPPALDKRQCLWSATQNTYTCDDHYPTIAEMVIRMRDATNDGKVTPQNHAFFYSGLRPPTTQEKWLLKDDWAVHYAWCTSYLTIVRKKPNHYGAAGALNPDWLDTQEAHIESKDRAGMIEADLEPGRAELLLPDGSPANAWAIFKMCYLQSLAAAAQNPEVYVFLKRGERWRDDSVWEHVEYWKLTQNPNVKVIKRVDPAPGACDTEQVLWERGRDAELPERWKCPVIEPEMVVVPPPPAPAPLA